MMELIIHLSPTVMWNMIFGAPHYMTHRHDVGDYTDTHRCHRHDAYDYTELCHFFSSNYYPCRHISVRVSVCMGPLSYTH